MKTKPIDTIARLLVLLSDIEDWPLESCGQNIWISRTCKCARMNLIGLPAKRLDVVIDRCLISDDLSSDEPVIAEIGNKTGKYDGAVRTRILIRRLDRAMENDPTYQWIEGSIGGEVVKDTTDDSNHYVLTATSSAGDTLWQIKLPMLRGYADPGKAREIVMWHYSRYFTHLPADEIASIASKLELPDNPRMSITAANRMASNLLYTESRERGWSKLTLRERQRLGLAHSGCWVRTDKVAQLRAERMGCDRSGTGEYTREVAKPLQATLADFCKHRCLYQNGSKS